MVPPTDTSKGDWDQMDTYRKTRPMNLSNTTLMKGATTHLDSIKKDNSNYDNDDDLTEQLLTS